MAFNLLPVCPATPRSWSLKRRGCRRSSSQRHTVVHRRSCRVSWLRPKASGTEGQRHVGGSAASSGHESQIESLDAVLGISGEQGREEQHGQAQGMVALPITEGAEPAAQRMVLLQRQAALREQQAALQVECNAMERSLAQKRSALSVLRQQALQLEEQLDPAAAAARRQQARLAQEAQEVQEGRERALPFVGLLLVMLAGTGYVFWLVLYDIFAAVANHCVL